MGPIRDIPETADRSSFAALLAGPWLSRQSAAFNRQLLALARPSLHAARQPVGFEGDEDRRIFGILSGSIGCLISHRQQMPVLGTIIGPGQWFGLGPLLAGNRRILSFMAREPTELIGLGDAELRQLGEACPDLPWRLAQLAQLQANHIAGLVSELLVPETDRRIAAVLLRLSEPGTGQDSFPVSQGELGEMANASRVSVSKALQAMAARGFVTVGYGRIAVADRARLEAWFEAGRAGS